MRVNADFETEARSPANSNPSTLVPHCGRAIYWWMHLQQNLLINESAWFMDKNINEEGEMEGFSVPPADIIKLNLFIACLNGNQQ